jgi:transposase
VTAFWRHRDQQTLTALGPSPGGCATVGSPKDNGRRRRGQEQPFLPRFRRKTTDCAGLVSLIHSGRWGRGEVDDGEGRVRQDALFYEFSLERHVPETHLLRSIDRFVELDGLRQELAPFYSEKGRPSIDPELLIRMLIVGYCFGIRSERRLCEEVHLNLAYRWFCRLGLDGDVPYHSTFSKNRHGRFRDSDLLRRLALSEAVPDVRKISVPKADLFNIEFFGLDDVMPGNQNERVPREHAKIPKVRNWAVRDMATASASGA